MIFRWPSNLKPLWTYLGFLVNITWMFYWSKDASVYLCSARCAVVCPPWEYSLLLIKWTISRFYLKAFLWKKYQDQNCSSSRGILDSWSNFAACKLTPDLRFELLKYFKWQKFTCIYTLEIENRYSQYTNYKTKKTS